MEADTNILGFGTPPFVFYFLYGGSKTAPAWHFTTNRQNSRDSGTAPIATMGVVTTYRYQWRWRWNQQPPVPLHTHSHTFPFST